MTYTARLRQKGLPFSGFGYMYIGYVYKGRDFTIRGIWNVTWGNLSFSYLKEALINISNRFTLWLCHFMYQALGWLHENGRHIGKVSKKSVHLSRWTTFLRWTGLIKMADSSISPLSNPFSIPAPCCSVFAMQNMEENSYHWSFYQVIWWRNEEAWAQKF